MHMRLENVAWTAACDYTVMCICENKLNVVVKAVSAAAHKGQPLSVMYQVVQMLVYSFWVIFLPAAAVLCSSTLVLNKNT